MARAELLTGPLLGFGGGLAPHEFAGLGIDQNKSRELYDDILDVLITALETGGALRQGLDQRELPRRAAAPKRHAP